jgi:hypothetical protein
MAEILWLIRAHRARVELEIATHPILVRQLDVSVQVVLEEALIAHRHALDIDPNMPDTLFNTAQVLVAIAEVLAGAENRVNDSLIFLEEALEMLNRCLSAQELRYEESERQKHAMTQAQTSNAAEEVTSATSTSAPSTPSDDAGDQWFSVVTPTTADTLIDTILAQLDALTTLTSILATTYPLPPTPTLSWIGSYPTPLLTEKLPLLTSNSSAERLQQIALTKANFISHLLEAGFRHATLNAEAYKSERDAAFSLPELSLPRPTAEVQLANAESLLAYASALAESSQNHDNLDSGPGTKYAQQRWSALSSAITILASASKTPDIDTTELVRTHLLRGDVSLLLAALRHPPSSLPNASSNAAQLLKNAEVFYRNASRLAGQVQTQQDVEAEETSAVAGLRCTVAQVLQGKTPEAPLEKSTGRSREWVADQIGDMVADGLLREDEGGLGVVA